MSADPLTIEAVMTVQLLGKHLGFLAQDCFFCCADFSLMSGPAPMEGVKEELPSPPRADATALQLSTNLTQVKASDVKSESVGIGNSDEIIKERFEALTTAARDATPQNFREKASVYGENILKMFGGPWQFLNHRFASEESKAEFASWLQSGFPRRYDLTYADPNNLPGDSEQRFVVMASDLGWASSCSTKPPPYLHTALSLYDEYLTRGFVSSGDELLLWRGQSPTVLPDNASFWTNFVKGAARSGTLLFLLALVKEAGWELNVLCPSLYDSILAIHCRVDMSCHDIQGVAYQNAMLSQAGSLRKAHDVPCWLMKIKLLQQKGLAAEEAIKKWNQQASKDGQLQGQKRTCLLNLLNCPTEACAILLSHASTYMAESVTFNLVTACSTAIQKHLGQTIQQLRHLWHFHRIC